MKTALVWFRNDLRIENNSAFSHSLENYDLIIPIYVWDEFSAVSKNMSSLRKKFLLESIIDLNEQLTSWNSQLLFCVGEEIEVIKNVYQASNACALLVNSSTGWYERQNIGLLQEKGMYCKEFSDEFLYPPEMQDSFSIANCPEIFTDFRKIIEKSGRLASKRPINKRALHPIPPPILQRFYSPIDSILSFQYAPSYFRGGRKAGLKRMHLFIWETNALATYKETRNGLMGDTFSSKLSAWLSTGCLSAREVYQEIVNYEKKVNKNESTYWLYFELLWRDFFKYIAMKHGRRLYKSSGIRQIKKESQSPDANPNWEKWKRGETGVPFIDANMRELLQTGFMSNRGRQNVASFLIHDLGIDWLAGAQWFEFHLIDHEASSNYGNWQYIAGVGNDPRPFRYFNVKEQGQRYDPDGVFIRHWLPELRHVEGDKIHFHGH